MSVGVSVGVLVGLLVGLVVGVSVGVFVTVGVFVGGLGSWQSGGSGQHGSRGGEGVGVLVGGLGSWQSGGSGQHGSRGGEDVCATPSEDAKNTMIKLNTIKPTAIDSQPALGLFILMNRSQ